MSIYRYIQHSDLVIHISWLPRQYISLNFCMEGMFSRAMTPIRLKTSTCDSGSSLGVLVCHFGLKLSLRKQWRMPLWLLWGHGRKANPGTWLFWPWVWQRPALMTKLLLQCLATQQQASCCPGSERFRQLPCRLVGLFLVFIFMLLYSSLRI